MLFACANIRLGLSQRTAQHYLACCLDFRRNLSCVFLVIQAVLLVDNGRPLDNIGNNTSASRRCKTLINDLKQMRVLQCCGHTLLVVQLLVDSVLTLMCSFPNRDINLSSQKKSERVLIIVE
jgi:hypothetical protein